MEKKILNFKKIIVPTRVVYQNSIRIITRINLDFVINGYSIYLDEESRLEKVIVNGKHPNSNPDTNEFCIPSSASINNDSLHKKLLTYNIVRRKIVMHYRSII